MAESPSAATESNSQPHEAENRVSDMNQTDSVPSQPQSSASVLVAANPNLNPPLIYPSHASLSFAPPPSAPSFRPLPPQFSSIINPGFSNMNYANSGVQPPGVNSAAPGGIATSVSVPQPMMSYQVFPGQTPNPVMRHYAPIPNGYAVIPSAVPHGTIPTSGIPRFTSPYASMVRAPFPPRPPGAIGVIPTMSRPLLPGLPGIRPIMPMGLRPVIFPSVTPAELPQTTIYIGRIAQTVENDFMLPLLQLCGPVKSWKRAQDPTNGTPRAFGFCEFESAEGVLRAIRLLTNFNVDGQELKLKGTQATRKYLRQYVEKKIENSKKMKETQGGEAKEEEGSAVVVEKNDPAKSAVEDSKEDNDAGEKEDRDIAISAIVSNEDKEADQEALRKLTSAVEERLKTRPLPPPSAQTVDGFGNADHSVKLRDGDSDGDTTRSDAADDKNDAETINDIKQTSDHDRLETSSPDRSRRYDRRSRERDRERDIKREKEREIERYERETERERIRKEREQRRKIEDADRQYEECLKEWEYREREKEKQRQYERDREKERERKRKKETIYDEEDEDDDSRKKWRRSVLEEKRKKKLKEKEDDLSDRQKEEEEIAEAKMRADEEQKQKEERESLKLESVEVEYDDVKTVLAEESSVEIKDKAVDMDYEGNPVSENHIGFESTLVSGTASDHHHSGNGLTKRLGFGLVGSGKRTTVPSVFHEEDDEAHKEKKMRPLVPIDYSVEELQAVQPPTSGVQPPNLAAAAEFAKRISNANTKEEKSNAERERGRRSNDKHSYRDKDRNDDEVHRKKDEHRSSDRERDRDRDRDRDCMLNKAKAPDNKKLLDAKQLIDMIPKTKEELFSYEINWAIYDKHELHERMRPWISKKITEFLGEEEATLVDYIVSSTQEHVKASQMLELLQSILDEEAEMFVLKMWRMLIFEIKKVETGIASRSKA